MAKCGSTIPTPFTVPRRMGYWIIIRCNHDLIYLHYLLSSKVSFFIDFLGIVVSSDFARNPGEIDKISPEGILYQSGYLTLRKDDDGKLSLDFPNGEVRKSIANLSVLAMVDDSVSDVAPFLDKLSTCLRSGEPAELFKHFREVLSGINYQSLFDDTKKSGDYADSAPGDKPKIKQPGEGVYQKFLQKYLEGAGVLAKKEESGNLGVPTWQCVFSTKLM
jgi:hypothetical protein